MHLTIIIINYKTTNLVIKCISSIKNTLGDLIDSEVLIVDNNSQDNSEEIITKVFPEVIWINNPTNEGFGRANNIGIKAAKGEYVLLLNSDVIVLPGTIEKCLEALKEDQQIGVLGCKLLNEDGSEQKSTFTIASFAHLLNQNLLIDKLFKLKEPKDQAIMGSFMLFPKKVLDEVGGFDPDFFMYSEELELCNRVLKAGYKIEQENSVAVIHEHGGSTLNKTWSIQQRFLSNALLFYKIHGFCGYFAYHGIYITNIITNFSLMWFLDSNYRKSFFTESKLYFSNCFYYIAIPLKFKRRMENGKRILKRG